MTHGTVSRTSVSQTSASGFHLSETMDWQSEWTQRRRGTVAIVPMSAWMLHTEVIALYPADKTLVDHLLGGILPSLKRGGISISSISTSLDWCHVEGRLYEIYPNPVGGTTAANIIADGRGEL